ncbi:hypothetical protein BB559_006477 [Furculomyces boomerangus]|uniref:Ribosomal RNA-processing protein 43 n=1 Tax=Furculomyces boomerangus TaxID=61424 RepID=A0A2T9Y2H8_9FUNG|nr:hypothetical protein BB559_006477 [Furculomyces boomerangus]
MSTDLFKAKIFQKIHPQEFHRRFFSKKLRTDGREFNDFRTTKVTQDGIQVADGSSTVRLGKTTIVCGIRAEVCEPKLQTPGKGYLVPNVKLTPMCSNKFAPGPPGLLSQVVSDHIYRLFDESVFPLDQLLIEKGTAVWCLYADIVCLNYDGNIFDASIIALMLALKNVVLPKVCFDETSGSVNRVKGEGSKVTLTTELFPSTFCLVEGSYLLTDPSMDEEDLADTFFFIVMDSSDNIVNMWKRGAGCGAEFQTENQDQPGYLSEELWNKFNNSKMVVESQEGKILDDQKELDLESNNETITKEKKTLNEEEIQTVLSGIEDLELKKLFVLDEQDIGETNIENIQETKKNGQELVERIICQRCFNIKHYNKLEKHWKEGIINDPRALEFLKYNYKALVIVVIDMFDIPMSIIPHLSQFIGEQHRILLVCNKLDLFPKDIKIQRLEQYILKHANSMELGINNIHLVSAQQNLGIRELAESIKKHLKPYQDIFFVGRANVGKSELINSLLRISYKTYFKHKLVASKIPGTTIGINGIPLQAFRKALLPMNTDDNLFSSAKNKFVYDTPGIFSKKSITNYLDNKELKVVIPSKRLVPLTYLLKPGQSIMFGGLGRLDFVSGTSNELRITVFSNIKIHKTNIEKADLLFSKLSQGQDTVLIPPINSSKERLLSFPKLGLALDLQTEGTHPSKAWLDIIFSGVGWFALSGISENYHIKAYSPNGIGVTTRDPMLPFEYKHWIKKYTSNMRKTS